MSGFLNKARAFYEANPDANLTMQEMASKFGVTFNTAKGYIKWLRELGVIEYRSCYVAGPAVKRGKK